MIVLNSADQVQCADPRPVLPSIESIGLYYVACSSTWLQSMFSALLTCDHKAMCTMKKCFMRSDGERVSSTIHLGKHTLNMQISTNNSPGLWEALHGLNIKCLTLSCKNERLEVNQVESLSKTLSSLKQLNTLTICVRNYSDIQLPQSLEYVNIYCHALHPSDLRKLVETLSACAKKIEGKLEFGCSCIKKKLQRRCSSFHFERVQVEEYMAIRQELDALTNVSVKRFQIFDRIKPNLRTCDADNAWFVRGICDADDDHGDFGNVHDDAYRQFIGNINDNDIIMNRISMRFVITPASIS